METIALKAVGGVAGGALDDVVADGDAFLSADKRRPLRMTTAGGHQRPRRHRRHPRQARAAVPKAT
jgi:hypothetical protein